jgi:hypothetical protein
MNVIFEINRDFPFQVALSFDEIAMEVLAWLDDRSFEWDMYVDLPRRRCGTVFAPPRTLLHLSSASLMPRDGGQSRVCGGAELVALYRLIAPPNRWIRIIVRPLA